MYKASKNCIPQCDNLSKFEMSLIRMWKESKQGSYFGKERRSAPFFECQLAYCSFHRAKKMIINHM